MVDEGPMRIVTLSWLVLVGLLFIRKKSAPEGRNRILGSIQKHICSNRGWHGKRYLIIGHGQHQHYIQSVHKKTVYTYSLGGG